MYYRKILLSLRRYEDLVLSEAYYAGGNALASRWGWQSSSYGRAQCSKTGVHSLKVSCSLEKFHHWRCPPRYGSSFWTCFMASSARKYDIAYCKHWRPYCWPCICKLHFKLLSFRQGEEVKKAVFVLFHQGEQAQNRARKICESFGARTYNCPESAKQRRDFLGQVKARLADLANVDCCTVSNLTPCRFWSALTSIEGTFLLW